MEVMFWMIIVLLVWMELVLFKGIYDIIIKPYFKRSK